MLILVCANLIVSCSNCYNDDCIHSWPEAARVLQRAVEESKKLKRRGAPNVVVFAGMPLPDPFEFPILISQRHVNFLHDLAGALGLQVGLQIGKVEPCAPRCAVQAVKLVCIKLVCIKLVSN